jgi:transcriptional regulator
MYVPGHFQETRIDVLQALIDRNPLGTLVAVTGEGLTANHIPMRAQLQDGGRGWLRGHIARGNSLWRELKDESAVLAIFTGADHYISPTWYPSKQEHGKAVPTWNYATVHLQGTIRFIDDAAWLRDFVTSLTEVHEGGRANRWHVSDAPPDYLEAMLRAIVGFEIGIVRTIGKFKGSQNRSIEDRAGARAGLVREGRTPADVVELVPESAAPP